MRDGHFLACSHPPLLFYCCCFLFVLCGRMSSPTQVAISCQNVAAVTHCIEYLSLQLQLLLHQ